VRIHHPIPAADREGMRDGGVALDGRLNEGERDAARLYNLSVAKIPPRHRFRDLAV
jgi:hypothetical protein